MHHTLNLRRNHILQRSGVPYRVVGRAKDGRLNLMNVNDETLVSVHDDDLVDEYSRGLMQIDRRLVTLSDRAQSLLDRDLSSLPEKTRRLAEFRRPFVKAMISEGRRCWSNGAIASLIKKVFSDERAVRPSLFERPPSVRSVRRWTSRAMQLGFHEVNDLRILVPRNHACGGRYERFAAEVVTLMDSVIDDFIMVPTHTTTREAYAQFFVQAQAKANLLAPHSNSLKLPSLRTFQRRVAAISDNEVTSARYGDEEANRRHSLVGRGPQGDYLLHEVEIDHTLADVIVVAEGSRVPIGRPTLTVALDRWSRMIVGVHIGLEAPGWRAAMLCLRNSILPKNTLLADDPAELRAKRTWPAMGLMDVLVTDNGPEFHGAALHHALQELGITLQLCPAGQPRYKGKTERLFRRMNVEFFHQLPGTTFSNPQQRGAYDSEKKAALTLRELRARLHCWITDIYCHTPHSFTKQTPHERWVEGVRMRPVTLPSSADALMKALALVEYRRLTRKGVELYGLQFSDPQSRELAAMLNDPELPPAVKVKVNSDDLEAVHIEDFRRAGRYIEVPCTAPQYARGLTLAEHNLFCTHVRARLKARERATMPMLVEAKARLRADIATLRGDNKLKSKKLNAVFPVTGKLLDVDDGGQTAPTTRVSRLPVAAAEAWRPAPRSLPVAEFQVDVD